MHRIGDRQDGLVTTDQLHALGFSDAAINWRIRTGRLRRVFRGVYLIGGRELSDRGRVRAAALVIGDDALAGYFASAWLHDFGKRLTLPVDIVVPRDVRSRPGITVHTVGEMPPFTRRHGIRVTTAERTILDLATVVRYDRAFRRLIHEAQVQRRTTVEMLAAEIERTPRHRGCKRVAEEIAYGPTPTRSGSEDDLVQILRSDPDLPRYQTCAHPPGTPAWVEVDVLFIEHRLVIEYDGDRWHNTEQRRESDGYKQRLVENAGYAVVRFNDERLLPGPTLARIHRELVSRAGNSPPNS